ncbi:Pancreatic lipase-related protein 2 [Frankliniella fusca]|uniref:Pancreatic lipase-related protein 2 n=1 Tax=Frankliniella fusca TaxID=407009 RepID=A0AAE1GZR7_9NEOP|nr:Pancreatic lipase-related protein 2 [Frankliniella fusca]
MRSAAPLLLLLLLADHGLGLPAPAPAPGPPDRSAGWPDLWGVLRAIRDTTAASAKAKSEVDVSNGTRTAPSSGPPRRSPLGHVTRQVSDRVSSVFMSVRSSLWHLTSTSLSAVAPTAAAPDLETEATSDLREADEDAEAEEKHTPQSLMSSALERVRGAGRAFTEMSRTVGRWGKAISDSVVGSTVNSAVGTVLQVIKGGKQDDDHVCFPELGCFSLLEPWSSSKRPLPRMNAPEDVQTQFFLYTRNATEQPLPIVAANDTVSNTRALLRDVKTFYVVHGFNDKYSNAWVQDMKDALLERVNANVILVDWAPGAQASRNYLQVASNTRIVGAELARMIELLADVTPLDSVHVIGHSLGAHAAGYAGKQLAGRLGRITALDAAQPAFEDQVAEVRVATGDARFVDVLHTNGVPFIPTLGLGVMHPIGDVDFYLNGGTVQPGCFVPKLPAVQSLVDLAALPVSVLGDMLSCSHRRAIEYFTEAVRSDCRMWGRRRAGDDVNSEGDGDKKRPVVETPRLTASSWWPSAGGLPSLGGLGLLAGMFSGGDKDRAATEATAPTPLRASFSSPLPATLASVPPTDSRRRGAGSGAPAAAYNKDVDVRPIDGNGISDLSTHSKSADYRAGALADAVADASGNKPASAFSERSPTTPPPPPPPAWCTEDCLPVGLDTDRYALQHAIKGTFNVLTADHPPYCMSQESNEVV